MKVALTAWEDRISPVFDSARTLLIAEIENAEIVSRRYATINPAFEMGLETLLKDLGVEVLICGAIARTPSRIIEGSGVELISFVGGDIEDVLRSYASGRSIVPAFSMPGCGRNFRRRNRGRNAFIEQGEEVTNMPNRDGTGKQGQGPGTGRGRGGCGPGQGGGAGSPGKGGPGGGQGQGGAGCGRGKGGGQGRGKGGGQGPCQGGGKGSGQGGGGKK